MWRPDAVVPQHKRRAVVLWSLLIAGILFYASWLIYDGVEKRKNPGTFFALSNKVYRYPDIWACLFDFYGCDTQPLEDECVRSIYATEGGRTRARYHPNGTKEQELKFAETLTDERGWCVVFEASALEVELGKERDPDDDLDYILLEMKWFPGGYPGNSTTCGVEDGKWEDHSESVFLYLNDTISGTVSTGIQVSYNCITNESTSHLFNYVGVGVTEEVNLDKTVNASYKALSTASTVYKDNKAKNAGVEAPYAYMAIKVVQEPDSLETVTEVDPLEIAELFGNVGGFWDLLLFLWPLFFVTTARQRPSFKTRDFKKSMTKVAESAMNVTRTRPSTSMSEADEVRPSWDKPIASSRYNKQRDREVLIRLFDDYGFVAVINGACVDKFLKSRFSAKCLKVGSLEPSLQKLLPPQTYLIVVRRGSTPESIAKAVATRCKTGDDKVDSSDKRPIAVKVKRPRLSLLQSQTLRAANYTAGIADIASESDVDLPEARFHLPTLSRNATEPTGSQLVIASKAQPIRSDTPIKRTLS